MAWLGLLAAGLADRLAELVPAFAGHGGHEVAFVLEMVVGRGRTDAGLSGHGSQRQGRWAFLFKDPSAGQDESPGEVSVMVWARLVGEGASAWAMGVQFPFKPPI